VARLQAGRPEFGCRQAVKRIFLSATTSKLALRPTQPPIQLVLGILNPGVKQLVREADHPLPSSAEAKNA